MKYAINKITKKKMMEYGFIAVMTFLHVIHFAMFYIYVNANAITMGFRDEITNNFTLRYFEIFKMDITSPTSIIKESITNTLLTFFVQNVIVFPIALLFSYFLYKKIAGYKYFRIVFFLPNIISAVVLTTLYRYILNGPIADLMMNMLDLEVPPLLLDSEKYAMQSTLLYIIWVSLGSNMVIHSGTLARIPAEIVDSCKIDGAGFFTELIHISIPLIWPTLSTLILLNIVSIFGASGPTLLLTNGNYGTSTLSFWIYRSTVITPNYHYASAVGLVFTCIGVPIAFFSKWIMGKISTGEEF